MLLKLLNVDPPEVPWTPWGPSGPRSGTPVIDQQSENLRCNLLSHVSSLLRKPTRAYSGNFSCRFKTMLFLRKCNIQVRFN